MDRFSSRSRRIGPKVRENRRMNRWGGQYYKAVQNVVFSKQCLPYMPTEPPVSLSEEIVESGPLYVCKQCRDCFRFQSSFEDHNARHSWILGLWCRHCFDTVCTHITNINSTSTAKCSLCIQKNNEKRAYLYARGLKNYKKAALKNYKMAAIKVFYNQCQFIEHMKIHRLSSVNIGDLMLIPLPLNMSNNDWSSEFEIVCEALMEMAFLLRKHIIDWLKEHNLQDNWWKLVNGKSNDAKIREIVNSYQGRQLFEPCNKSRTDVFTNYNSSNVIHSSSSENIEDNNTNNYSIDITSDKNILENEDNPCTSTDITFVDCGPTSQCFEPEIPVNYTYKTAQEIKNCHVTNTIRMNNKTMNETFKNRNLYATDMIHKNVKKTADNNHNKPSNLINTKTSVIKIPDNSIKIDTPFPAKKSQVIKTNLNQSKQTLQTSRTNNKILNRQGSKNIASVISQFPSHLISNKKVVVIGQNSCNVITDSENEVSTKKDSSNSILDNNDSNTSIAQMCDSNIKKQEIIEKIVIKKGQKYLVKRIKKIKTPKSSSDLSTVKNTMKVTKQIASEHNISKPNLSPNSFNEVGNTDIQQTTLFHNDISLLTPSPSPSELSNNSSCESQVKKTLVMPKLQKIPPHLISISAMHPTQKYRSETISLIKEENGDLYMDIKEVDRITKESFLSVCDVIVRYTREMFDEFYEMNTLELKERLEHLQCVSEEMRHVLNFMSDTIFKEKLRTINTFQRILEECLRKRKEDIQDKKNDDVILNEWETKLNPRNKIYCLLCNKCMKPKSYIVGFSKLSKNDNKYCSCYKQVCHECLSYQGSKSQFIAHQNFHKRRKPYVCPDCDSKFNSITSLEIHTWTVCFHISKKVIFSCKICEIDGFRDLESITRHFVIMHSKTKIGCEDCNRVFTSYNEYVQHCTETHPSKTEQNPVRLVICKLSNVILRYENYMSYLEKYPGIRKLVWFKCPFCHLITTDNKHVTTLLNTHIRSNHVKSLSKILTKKAFTEIFGANSIILRAKTDFLNTMMPKIVNTRTISSEIFERGSQNMEHVWSTDINEVVNENLQTMKKIDGKEKEQLLPKIVSVVSMNDLKASTSKKTITKFSIETKMKSNSPFQVIVNNDKKMNSFTHKETAIELNDSKSNIKEAKKNKLDKDNNELIMNTSHISKSEKSLSIDTVDLPIESSNKVSNSTSEASTDSRIKIVDFRKICKPDIKPLVITEICDTQTKNENASCIPKPPPLVRIPKHLLKHIEVNESENESVNCSAKSRSKKSLVQKVTDNSKVRIALGDTQKEGNIDYLCHLCNERINTSQFVMQAHFREKHSDEYRVAVITPQLSRISHDFINDDYKQFINNRKRKSDNALFVSKRKRRWTPKKHTEIKDVNLPVGLCVEQETVEDDEGNFICKKCGQQCSNMSNLREHIAANHRLKGRYLICLECGENFVVIPSLQMHLKAFHGIEDPMIYMNQNPSYASNFDSDLQTEERTTVANQCYVCMAVFEDKAAVDKHLRVHGMAFLNRKRIEARNALEKKNNIKEDKQNIIKDDSKETVKQDKPIETILEKINAAI